MSSSNRHSIDFVQPLPSVQDHGDIELEEITFKSTSELPQETRAPIEDTSVLDTQPEPIKEPFKFRNFAIITSLCCTLFIAALNRTIVATASPTIAAKLNSNSGYAWISAAYLLANTTLAPLWSKLSDIWGRKPILLTAVAWYFLTSIICATSQSVNVLILGRTLQGTAGGGLIQMVYIVISDLYSMRTRTMYLGLLQIMFAIAGGVGPVIGGLLTQYASWRWIFWINLPISGATFLLLLIFLDVHNPKTKFSDGVKAIDWFGSVSIIGAMGMLMVGLNFGGAMLPWSSPTVICLLIFGSLMTVFFIISEKKLAHHPIMPLGLFKNKSNVAILIIGSTHDFALFAAEFYLPLYFQAVKGSSPFVSGALILPVTFFEAIVGMITGIIVHQTGQYVRMIYIGVVILTLGNGLYINLDVSSSTASIVGFELVSAIGAGLLFQPPLIALQAQVQQKDTATATATLGFVRNLATSLSVVVGGLVFQNRMDTKRSELLAEGLSANLTQLITGPAAQSNVMVIDTISDPVQQLAVKTAFSGALNDIWILCAVISSFAVFASWFVTGKRLTKDHVEFKTGLVKDTPTGVVDTQVQVE